MPRHARIAQHDVRGGIPPDAIFGAAFQPVIGTPRPNQQRRRGMRSLRHWIAHRRVPLPLVKPR